MYYLPRQGLQSQVTVTPAPKMNTIEGEICAFSPVFTRYSALFFAQSALIAFYLALFVALLTVTQTTNTAWLKLFLIIWSVLYTVLIGLHTIFYSKWLMACCVISPTAEPKMIIGTPMHTALQKSSLTVSVISLCIANTLLWLLIATGGGTKPLQHSNTAGILYVLMFLAMFGIAAMFASLANQAFPRISVARVTVFCNKGDD